MTKYFPYLVAALLTTTAEGIDMRLVHTVLPRTNTYNLSIGRTVDGWTVTETNAQEVVLNKGTERIHLTCLGRTNSAYVLIDLDTSYRYRLAIGDEIDIEGGRYRLVVPSTNTLALQSLESNTDIAIAPLTELERNELRTNAFSLREPAVKFP